MLTIVTSVSIYNVEKISSSLKIVNDLNSVKQRYAINFRGSVHDRAISLRDVSLLSTSAELDTELAEIERLTVFYKNSAGPLDAMMPKATPEERAILAEIKDVERRTLPLIEQVVALKLAGDPDQARSVLMAEARPNFVQWLKSINKFIDYQEAANKRIGAEVSSVAQGFALIMVGTCGVAITIGAGLALWTIRSISPLRQLNAALLKMADGQYEVALPIIRSRDEVGEMTRSAEVFRANLIEAERLRKTPPRLKPPVPSALKPSARLSLMIFNPGWVPLPKRSSHLRKRSQMPFRACRAQPMKRTVRHRS